jgi:hypothetical protein
LTALEEGVKTRHTEERKAPSKKDVVCQKSVDQAAEATRLNGELRRHNKELVRIVQQALEEFGRIEPQVRITQALYLRIEDCVPSILKDIPQGINPFNNATPGTQDLSSVSSLDSLTGSLPSGLKRDTDESNVTPSKRHCSATSLTAGLTGATSQRQYEVNISHDMPTQSSSTETTSDFHQPQNTRMTSRPLPPTRPTPPLAQVFTNSGHEGPPEPQVVLPTLPQFPSEMTAPTFEQHDNPQASFEFHAEDDYDDQDFDIDALLNWDNQNLQTF